MAHCDCGLIGPGIEQQKSSCAKLHFVQPSVNEFVSVKVLASSFAHPREPYRNEDTKKSAFVQR